MDHRTYPSSLPYALPSFCVLMLTKEIQGLPLLTASGIIQHPCVRPLQLSYRFLAVFPPSFQHLHRSKTQANSCSRNAFQKAKAFPKPKRIPRNYPNNQAPIMRAFRTAPHNFHHSYCFPCFLVIPPRTSIVSLTLHNLLSPLHPTPI